MDKAIEILDAICDNYLEQAEKSQNNKSLMIEFITKGLAIKDAVTSLREHEITRVLNKVKNK